MQREIWIVHSKVVMCWLSVSVLFKSLLARLGEYIVGVRLFEVGLIACNGDLSLRLLRVCCDRFVRRIRRARGTSSSASILNTALVR